MLVQSVFAHGPQIGCSEGAFFTREVSSVLGVFMIFELRLTVCRELTLVTPHLTVPLHQVDVELNFKWSFVRTKLAAQLDRGVLHYHVLL